MSEPFPESLAARGFVDTRPDHPWNYSCCDCALTDAVTLTVWRRNDYDPFLIVVADPGDYERQVNLKAVRDIGDALPLIDALIALKGLL